MPTQPLVRIGARGSKLSRAQSGLMQRRIAEALGVPPEDADAFIAACRQKYGLEICGLMCVPPVDEQASPHFALLADIAARNGLKELSMGMSSDYELAIQLGDIIEALAESPVG